MAKINLPKQIFGKQVDGAMKRVLEKKDLEDNTSVKQPKTPVTTQDSGDYWTISGVNYRNGIHVVDLSKSLLDNGNSKTQNEWAEYSEQARQRGEFHVADMPLYHSVFTALFKQKDNPNFSQTAEEARVFIQKQMREKYQMTLTRIAYQHSGKDEIIHNYGLTDKYELEEKIIGPDREILKEDNKTLKALLGIENVDEIKAVYNWINQTPTWSDYFFF
jgi:hypothetical protein